MSGKSHVAHKIVRLMWKSGAVKDIGHQGCWLVASIAHVEDELHYCRPAKFWNSQLCDLLDVSDDTLSRIIKRCVESGWLSVYRENNRSIGQYRALIPADVPESLDSHVHMSPAEELAANTRSDADNPEGNTRTAAENAETNTRNSRGNPAGNPAGTSNPDPDPKESRAHTRRFTDEDRQTAELIFRKIRELNPGHKEPNLDEWANTIRLLREPDGRTDEQIRELFGWANQNEFWATNILSPSKLRKQWDMLVIQRNGKPNLQQPQSKPPEPARQGSGRARRRRKQQQEQSA